jgi:hypothetical protein
METIFNFGGFYGSVYEDAIDDVVYEDDVENTIDPDAVDFKNLHNEVAKAITENFAEYIDDEFGVELTLEYVELNSPRFYNYSTDTISVKISKEDLIQLDLLVINDADLQSILEGIVEDTTTSRSGYIPFYNYDEVMAKINDDNISVYYQSLLDALMEYNKASYEAFTLELLNETISNHV